MSPIPQLWTEVVFGLTPGWWRFTDRDLRQEHPLLGRSQWESVLREIGFAETITLPGLVGPEGEGQIGLLARKSWQKPAETPVASAQRFDRSAVRKVVADCRRRV